MNHYHQDSSNLPVNIAPSQYPYHESIIYGSAHENLPVPRQPTYASGSVYHPEPTAATQFIGDAMSSPDYQFITPWSAQATVSSFAGETTYFPEIVYDPEPSVVLPPSEPDFSMYRYPVPDENPTHHQHVIIPSNHYMADTGSMGYPANNILLPSAGTSSFEPSWHFQGAYTGVHRLPTDLDDYKFGFTATTQGLINFEGFLHPRGEADPEDGDGRQYTHHQQTDHRPGSSGSSPAFTPPDLTSGPSSSASTPAAVTVPRSRKTNKKEPATKNVGKAATLKIYANRVPAPLPCPWEGCTEEVEYDAVEYPVGTGIPKPVTAHMHAHTTEKGNAGRKNASRILCQLGGNCTSILNTTSFKKHLVIERHFHLFPFLFICEFCGHYMYARAEEKTKHELECRATKDIHKDIEEGPSQKRRRMQ